jgi:hypothetical protein
VWGDMSKQTPRKARVTQEPIRLKYNNLGDFGGSDPIVDSWYLEVAGPYEAMQALMPLLKKYKFQWSPLRKSWNLNATLYAYSNKKRQDLWESTRRNQKAVYPVLKKMVDEYNKKVSEENKSEPLGVKGLIQHMRSRERLYALLKKHGLAVEWEFPDRYSVDEARTWVLGNTFVIKDLMKKYGFRWGSSPKHGKGWWLPAVEYKALEPKWSAEVLRTLPSLPEPSVGQTPFTDMSRPDLLRWIKEHNVVSDDMMLNEGYDGEVSESEVLAGYLMNMPKWKPEKQQEVFERGSIVPQGYRYATRKCAGRSSWVAETLMKAESDLTRKAQRYTGESNHTRARIESNPNGWPVIHVWLQLQEDEGIQEAQEISDILLGRGATVTGHKLVPGLWVAEVAFRPK